MRFARLACLYVLPLVSSLLTFLPEKEQKKYLQVETKNGVIQGIRVHSEAPGYPYYYAYMGIPYAKAPIGHLRFEIPQKAENWSGVLDARKERSGCIEFHLRVSSPFKVVGEEDCLFINVYTQENPRKTKTSKAVMVFIYGGQYLEGNSDATNYGPDLLVSKDVVVVLFNYRVGIFGFLSTGDLAAPGNNGLKDQNMALRWVQANIRNFGGDPNRVTLFGQSAGAVSAQFHMLSPKSKGLFQRVALESGSVLCNWGSRRRPRDVAYLLGVVNGITNPKDSWDLVKKLKNLSVNDLANSQLVPILFNAAQLLLFGLPLGPTTEPNHPDAFISEDHWFEMLKNGNFNRVPVLAGVTSEEAYFYSKIVKLIQLFLFVVDIDKSFLASAGMNISDFETKLKVGNYVNEHYLKDDARFATVEIETILKYVTMDHFFRPVRKSALLMSKFVPVYFYVFSHRGSIGAYGIHEDGRHPGLDGVAHGEEMFYIFNKFNNTSQNMNDHKVRDYLLNLWTNFAKFGNPTPRKEELLENVLWPAVSPSDQPEMKMLEIDGTLKIRDSFEYQSDLIWWENLFEKYAVPPLRTY